MKVRLVALWIVLLFMTALFAADESFSFLAPDKAPVLQTGKKGSFSIRMSVQKGFYLYKEALAISINPVKGIKAGDPVLPPSHTKMDPETQAEIEVFTGESTISVPLSVSEGAPARGKLVVKIDYRGCSARMCYMPTSQTLEIPFTVEKAATAAEGKKAEVSPEKASQETPSPAAEPAPSPAAEPPAAAQSAQAPSPSPSPASSPAPTPAKAATPEGFGGIGYFVMLFLAGVLTSFTPCVYPVIPITISVFGARGAESKIKAFLLSFTYVQGIAIVYSSLGVVVAMTGAVFGQHMSNPWVVGTISLIFFLLGLFMAGALHFTVPSSMQTKASHVGGKGFLGAFTMGMVSGVIAAPCTGPALAGVLMGVSTTRNALLGFALLYTYSMGLGLLFLLLGTFSSLIQKLPRSGSWMENVKSIFAVAMFTVALYFLNNQFNFLKFDSIPGMQLILFGLLFFIQGLLSRGITIDLMGARPTDWFKKFATLLLLTLGAFLLILGFTRPEIPVPAAGTPTKSGSSAETLPWQTGLKAAKARAMAENRPLMVDFYADWCNACKELDHVTYADPSVQAELKRFVIVKVDMSRSTPENDQLKQEYGIVGLPVVAFHDGKGQLLPNPRVTGFEKPDAFLSILKQVH